MNNKRGEIAISTIIILIASILLVVSMVFILFNNAQVFSSMSYDNIKFADSFISKGIDILDVSASDGRNNYFDTFYLTVGLLPDSKPIDFANVQVSVKTSDSNVFLSFRNGTPHAGSDGFETFAKEDLNLLLADSSQSLEIHPDEFLNLHLDIDGDGNSNDFVATCDATYCDVEHRDVALIFNLSSAGFQYAWLNDTSGSLVDISPIGAVAVDISYSPIGDANNPYGFVTTKDTKVLYQTHTLTPTGPFTVYASPVKLLVDLDMDGNSDFVVLNDTHLRILPSSQKISIDIDLGGDISAGSVNMDVTQNLILDNGSSIGSIDILGLAGGGFIPESTSVDIIPILDGVGHFQIEYLTTSKFHLVDHLWRGEIAKIYLKSPKKLFASDIIRFNVVVPTGISSPVGVFTGDTVPANKHVFLYPKI